MSLIEIESSTAHTHALEAQLGADVVGQHQRHVQRVMRKER